MALLLIELIDPFTIAILDVLISCKFLLSHCFPSIFKEQIVYTTAIR